MVSLCAVICIQLAASDKIPMRNLEAGFYDVVEQSTDFAKLQKKKDVPDEALKEDPANYLHELPFTHLMAVSEVAEDAFMKLARE